MQFCRFSDTLAAPTLSMQDLGGSVAGSGSSDASKALTARRAEEVDREPSDYYFQDALLDVAERFREHGGTPD